jgi:hypothetical protein
MDEYKAQEVHGKSTQICNLRPFRNQGDNSFSWFKIIGNFEVFGTMKEF